MYFKSLEALIQKIMDLHNIRLTPNLIIIESLHTFSTYNQGKKLENVLQGYAKTLAGLQSCVESFSERFKGSCWSIVSLDDNVNGLYNQENLATFIDLFYYKKNYLRVQNSTFVQWLNQFKSKFLK